jgi:hypothetical protein
MKKYITSVGAGLMLAMALMPLAASAQSVSDIQSQIQALMNQIQTLQGQLHAIQASTTPSGVPGTGMMQGTVQGTEGSRNCPQLTRDLGIGSRGDDVKEVQNMLAQDPSIFTGTTTGFFGPATAKAMAKFQKKFGVASSSTGFIGKMTREFFGKRCPQMMGNSQGDDNRGRGMMGSSTPGMMWQDDHGGRPQIGTSTNGMVPRPPHQEGERGQGGNQGSFGQMMHN